MEGLEEGGLGGEPGECERYVPGIGWREADRERQDAVAVVAFCISGVPLWLLERGRDAYRPSYLNPAFGAFLLLNFQLRSTRTTFSSGSSRSIVFVSLKTPGSLIPASYLISPFRPRSIS